MDKKVDIASVSIGYVPVDYPLKSPCLLQLSPNSKVARWFEALNPVPLSRPESGFVDFGDTDVSRESLLRVSSRKKKLPLRLKLRRATTF